MDVQAFKDEAYPVEVTERDKQIADALARFDLGTERFFTWTNQQGQTTRLPNFRKNVAGIEGLGHYVFCNLTIREFFTFKKHISDRRFACSEGEHDALSNLWERLNNEIFQLIGATTILNIEDDTNTYLDYTPAALSAAIPKVYRDKLDAVAHFAELKDMMRETRDATEVTANGVGFLVSERKRAKAANQERGKANQRKGDTEERERAARDKAAALKMVHVRITERGENVLDACRHVCEHFKQLTTRKNALGKYEKYAPLTKADGKEMKPDTLAKAYREKYGTKRAQKSGGETERTE